MAYPYEQLGNVAEFINGFAFKPHHWGAEGKKIIRIQNLTDKSKPYNRTKEEVDRRYLVRNGDLLVSWSATLDVFEWQDEDAFLNQHIFKVVPDYNKLDKSYFRYALKKSIESMFKYTRGSTMKHINRGDFLGITISLPSLKEQQRIAAILDKTDAIRRKRQQTIRLADQFLQAVFLDIFGDPVKNPKGWEVVKLGDICGVGSSKRVFVDEFTDSGVPFYRGTEVGHLAENEDIQPHLFISKEHYETLKRHSGVPSIGDLLLPSICHDGRIWKVDHEQPFYFKDGRVLWIKVNQNLVNCAYLKSYLKYLFIANYSSIASGTTFAELKIINLKELAILSPPLGLQIKYSEIEKIIMKKYGLKKDFLGMSNELFYSLSQKAFAGKL